MKQSKKLIRNCWIILFVLWATYYFGGYYLSEEKCIADILKVNYVKDVEKVMSLDRGNDMLHLYSNGTDENAIVITTKCGFLYHRGDYYFDFISPYKKEGFELLQCSNSEYGLTAFIYRYDKNIQMIEVEMNDDTSLVLSDWKGDFLGFSLEKESYKGGKYVGGEFRAYDKDYNLVETRGY